MPNDATNATAAEQSEFSYEPPDNAQEFDVNAEANDAIDSIVEEFSSSDNLDGEPVEAEPAKEATPEPEAEEVEDPKLARGIERVVARELAAKDAEGRAKAAESQATARLTELKTLEAKLAGAQSAQDLAQMMALDPAGALKKMGFDPTNVIRMAMAQELGDEAPPALKELLSNAARDRRVIELENRLATQDRHAAARTYFDSVSNGAREWLKKTGDSNPALADALKADADLLHSEVMEEITTDAKAKAATDPNGEPMSYQDAYARVEARGRKLAALFTPQGSATEASKTAPGTQPVRKPTTPPTAKPAPKPLAKPQYPWLKPKDNVEEVGIQEALREFNRFEAERKARR